MLHLSLTRFDFLNKILLIKQVIFEVIIYSLIIIVLLHEIVTLFGYYIFMLEQLLGMLTNKKPESNASNKEGGGNSPPPAQSMQDMAGSALGGIAGGVIEAVKPAILPIAALLGGLAIFNPDMREKIMGMFGGVMKMLGMGGGEKSPEETTGRQDSPSNYGNDPLASAKTSLTNAKESLMGSNSTKFNPAKDGVSYARNAGAEGREFLNAKDYEGKISIPQTVIDDAKAKNKDVEKVYAMITIDASNNNGVAVARGFHVFHDLEKNTTKLIPFVSGGAAGVDNAKDSKSVEATNSAPMPFLVTDATKKGDGINRIGKIASADFKTNDEFGFFVEYDDGLDNRSGIGSHENLRHGSKGGQGISKGCPVVRPNDVGSMQTLMKEYGVASGSSFYILDSTETVNTSENAVKNIAKSMGGITHSDASTGNKISSEVPQAKLTPERIIAK